MNRRDELIEIQNAVLLVLLERAGGQIDISPDEWERVRHGNDSVLVDEADRAGFVRVHLIPDYVRVDRGLDQGQPIEPQVEYDHYNYNDTVPTDPVYNYNYTVPTDPVYFGNSRFDGSSPLLYGFDLARKVSTSSG